MMPWYSFLTDLGDRGAETAIRSNRRAVLAIRAEKLLLPEQKCMYVCMYVCMYICIYVCMYVLCM